MLRYVATAGHEAARMIAGLIPATHQRSNVTRADRYPVLFAAAAAEVPEARRVLSYGCSTGEECVSLARYFPKAEIVGADINPLNLAVARLRTREPRVRFLRAGDALLAREGPFDAVFCLAVLTIAAATRDVANAQAIYPFERFAERAAFLDGLVRSGGLLAIHGSAYRFRDTAQSAHYEVIPVAEAANPYVAIFGRDGERLADQAYADCLFRKRPT